jgi:hypothetical protein
MKFIVVLAAITPPLGLWSVKLSEQVSTGHLPWPMQRSWSAAATDVSFSPNIYTYQHMRSRPYQPPGHLHAGDNFKCVFVLIDKFSKWIEYMPLTKASSEKAVEFLDQIIHRFGLPNNIIIDLGTQFTSSPF